MNPTVLIVADNVALQRRLRSLLQEEGFAVELARGAVAGLFKVAGDLNIDVVLTEVEMAPMDGFQLAEELEKFRPGMPIVFVTPQLESDTDTLAEELCLAMAPELREAA